MTHGSLRFLVGIHVNTLSLYMWHDSVASGVSGCHCAIDHAREGADVGGALAAFQPFLIECGPTLRVEAMSMELF